jgi:hypothetical protein
MINGEPTNSANNNIIGCIGLLIMTSLTKHSNMNTHAKNKFYRRIANKRIGGNPDKGKPIDGELTATEIAHKERRAARRIPNMNRRLTIMVAQIQQTSSAISTFTKGTSDGVDHKQELDALHKKRTKLEADKVALEQKILKIK